MNTFESRIDPKYELRASFFGISFNLQEHLPQACDRVLLYIVKDKEIVNIGIFLPHQLYLQDLKEKTDNGKYPMYFKPYFPKYPSQSIFIEEEEAKTKWQKVLLKKNVAVFMI